METFYERQPNARMRPTYIYYNTRDFTSGPSHLAGPAMAREAAPLPPCVRCTISVLLAPIIVLAEGINSCLGKWVYSFFDPSLASTFGSFGTFVGVGALALPLALIPLMIMGHIFGDKAFWGKHPIMEEFLRNILGFIFSTATVAASILIIGNPLMPTLVPMILLPAMFCAFNTIRTAIKGLNYISSEDTWDRNLELNF